jgi:hypothetical protein
MYRNPFVYAFLKQAAIYETPLDRKFLEALANLDQAQVNYGIMLEHPIDAAPYLRTIYGPDFMTPEGHRRVVWPLLEDFIEIARERARMLQEIKKNPAQAVRRNPDIWENSIILGRRGSPFIKAYYQHFGSQNREMARELLKIIKGREERAQRYALEMAQPVEMPSVVQEVPQTLTKSRGQGLNLLARLGKLFRRK